jgi:hypothetical protein
MNCSMLFLCSFLGEIAMKPQFFEVFRVESLAVRNKEYGGEKAFPSLSKGADCAVAEWARFSSDTGAAVFRMDTGERRGFLVFSFPRPRGIQIEFPTPGSG